MLQKSFQNTPVWAKVQFWHPKCHLRCCQVKMCVLGPKMAKNGHFWPVKHRPRERDKILNFQFWPKMSLIFFSLSLGQGGKGPPNTPFKGAKMTKSSILAVSPIFPIYFQYKIAVLQKHRYPAKWALVKGSKFVFFSEPQTPSGQNQSSGLTAPKVFLADKM